MATVTVTQVRCDLCGGDAVRTSIFKVRKNTKASAVEREIDLCEVHAAEFDASFADLLTASRVRPKPQPKSQTNGDGDVSKEIRAWARQNGFDVGVRGRLSPEVVTAWENRNN